MPDKCSRCGGTMILDSYEFGRIPVVKCINCGREPVLVHVKAMVDLGLLPKEFLYEEHHLG